MKYLMKRRSVERIADTQVSYEKLKKLGYEVKKDLEAKEEPKKVETSDEEQAESPEEVESPKSKRNKKVSE